MTQILHVPDFPLSCYVDWLWYTDAPALYSREKILPAPNVDLMINFGDPFQVYAADDKQPPVTCSESWWVGLQSRYTVVEFPPNTNVLSMSFKPGGAYPFLHLPLSELQDQVIPLAALWGSFAAEVRDRLYDVPAATERIALLERLLLARLCEVPSGWGAMQFAVGRIARRHGVISIRALSGEMNMSHKHLIAQFKRMIGISPKLLARIYRFQHLLTHIDPTQPVNWAEVAHQLSYHDQSHFSKDLKAFTGLSPGNYLRQRQKVLEVAPQYAHNLHHLAIG